MTKRSLSAFKTLAIAIAAAGSMSFSGCSGGGSSDSSIPAGPVSPGPVGVKTAKVKMVITVPTVTKTASFERAAASVRFAPSARRSVASSERQPRYISAGAASISITQVTNNSTTLIGGTTTTVNLALNSTGANYSCANSTPITCTVTETLPLGTDSFQVGIYSGSGGTGNVLGTGAASMTVTTGAEAILGISVGGVVQSIGAVVASIAAGTASSASVALTLLDAAGNTIIGESNGTETLPDGQVISLGDQILAGYLTATLGANGAMVLNPSYTDPTTTGCTATSLAAALCTPTDSLAIAYSGLAQTSTSLTFARTTQGLQALGSITLQSMTPQVVAVAPVLSAISPAPTSASLTVGGASATLKVSETGWTNSDAGSTASPYGQTFTMTDSSCSGIATVTAGSVGASGEAFTVAPVAQGSCTASFIEDETGGYTAPHAAVSVPITVAYGSLVASPASLTWANNVTSTQTETISEPGYSGTITQSLSACKINSTSTASLSSNVSSGNAPASFVLTPQGGSTCDITYTDNHGDSLTVPVSITDSGILIH